MSRATKLKRDIVKLQMEVSKLKHDNATLRRQLNTALDLAYEANNLALSSARPVPTQTRESSRNPIFDEQGIESVIPLFAGTGVRLSTIDDRRYDQSITGNTIQVQQGFGCMGKTSHFRLQASLRRSSLPCQRG